MTDPAIRILIVDDHSLVREGIRQALSVPGFEVVGEAGSGPEGLEMARVLTPDVIVLDVSLPGMSGIQTAARVRALVPETRVLMLSVHDHAEYVLEAVKAGAHGYLRKDTLPQDLRQAIRTVHEGRTSFADFVDTPSAIAPVLESNTAQRLALLTPREREVLLGIADGKTNKQMAATLDLSVRTVESYRDTLMQKLGIRSVAGLTRFAIDSHLIGPS
jgi:DNA-binding NarL/FixJ family response regulator